MGFSSRMLAIFERWFSFLNGLSLRWDRSVIFVIFRLFGKIFLFCDSQSDFVRRDSPTGLECKIFVSSWLCLCPVLWGYQFIKWKSGACVHLSLIRTFKFRQNHEFIPRRNSFLKRKLINFLASIGGGDDPFLKRTSANFPFRYSRFGRKQLKALK